MHKGLKLKGHRVLNQSQGRAWRGESNEVLLVHFDFAPAHGEYMRRRNAAKKRGEE